MQTNGKGQEGTDEAHGGGARAYVCMECLQCSRSGAVSWSDKYNTKREHCVGELGYMQRMLGNVW